jgi:rhomboid protease GluP
MNQGSEIPLRVTADPNVVEEWQLVLLAQGLSPSISRGPDGFILSVPEEEAEKARSDLFAYESEKSAKLAEASDSVDSPNLLAGSGIAGMLVLVFFSVTVIWLPAVPWIERGSADAHRMLHGELWRAVTALTLHADIVHAVSNAVAAALFLSAVSSMLGTGLGCILVLLAGAGGNLANGFFHGSPHVSLGASTSVFGAVGVLAALGMARRRRALSGRRVWLPIAAALALLAMLGTQGQRVDIWAHLFGLLVGGVLGILIGLVTPGRPGSRIQWACGSAAFAVLLYSWILALR